MFSWGACGAFQKGGAGVYTGLAAVQVTVGGGGSAAICVESAEISSNNACKNACNNDFMLFFVVAFSAERRFRVHGVVPRGAGTWKT